MLDWKSHPRPIIALSPMADMTDSAFCRVVRDLSPPDLIVFREMVSSEAVVRGNEKTLGMTDIHPTERPLVQQIFGADPTTMAEAARLIEAEHHPDGFDINMGCPVYKIVHNFNGAALMKEPELATKIVKAMKLAITVPLSVKIRLGWSDPTQCLDFIKTLENAGADLVTIHGRTKSQGYSGKSDWAMIGEAKKQVSIPVLCNGDIHKPEDASKALSLSKCDGVMVARGALGNPWIFSQMFEVLAGQTPTPVTMEKRLRVIRLHAKYHVEQYGERGIVSFRKHLTWYFKGLPGAKILREQLHNVSTLADLEKILCALAS
ncbi:MAG: tRNA dihydrouridine synthase DusB [Patescibacteria group bacterium]